MSELVEFPLEGGGSVVVEVDRSGSSGGVRRGLGDRSGAAELSTRASETLEAALARVQPAALALVANLQLSAAIGAIIARTSGEANFRVSLTWHRNGGKAP